MFVLPNGTNRSVVEVGDNALWFTIGEAGGGLVILLPFQYPHPPFTTSFASTVIEKGYSPESSNAKLDAHLRLALESNFAVAGNNAKFHVSFVVMR